jgi:glycerophosphoryl diester phosphodiesterase
VSTVSSTTFILTAACCVAILAVAPSVNQEPPNGRKPWLIAHRWASAYAPENTLPAFRLAADQGADWVEFDLQMTKDRQVVCLHDNSLERTTDVEELFPDRFRRSGDGTQSARRWMLRAEMAHYLRLGVDGVITDNPDLMPRDQQTR